MLFLHRIAIGILLETIVQVGSSVLDGLLDETESILLNLFILLVEHQTLLNPLE